MEHMVGDILGMVEILLIWCIEIGGNVTID